MQLNPSKIEVMQFLAQKIESVIEEFLKNIDTNWQPSDFLPESNNPEFTKDAFVVKTKTCMDHILLFLILIYQKFKRTQIENEVRLMLCFAELLL